MAKRFILIAAMLFLPALAKADEITTYTYNNGPAPANLSGSFTTSVPLTPGTVGGPELINTGFTNVLSWNFTDGVDTWTPANSTFDGGAFVNPDGTFLDWNFTLVTAGGPAAFSQTAFGAFYNQDVTPLGDSFLANFNLFNKPMGSFTVTDVDTVATPEPGALILLAAGLGALVLAFSLRNLAA
jgi:hypothetical protein